MTDLASLPPCPSNPQGFHRFEGWAVTMDENASLTWLCRYCGALRQVSAFGPLYEAGSKDALPNETIATLWSGTWETR